MFNDYEHNISDEIYFTLMRLVKVKISNLFVYNIIEWKLIKKQTTVLILKKYLHMNDISRVLWQVQQIYILGINLIKINKTK